MKRGFCVDLADDSTFTWKDIEYTVRANGKDLKLLDKVSGYCKAGTLTALVSRRLNELTSDGLLWCRKNDADGRPCGSQR
jgi:ATP-binding cassette subfamily G (WHITE) protein 2 (SNQ2)